MTSELTPRTSRPPLLRRPAFWMTIPVIVLAVGVITYVVFLLLFPAGSARGSASQQEPSTAPATTETNTPTPVPTPADAARALPRVSDLPIGTVIATGTFDARGVTGRIEIRTTKRDNGMEITLADVSPAPPAGSTLELNSLPDSASEEAIAEAYSYYRYDVLHATSDQSLTTPGEGYGGFETNDPTYLRTAVIYGSDGFQHVFATAPLTWNLPDMNPSLNVIDHGAAEAANGTVALADDATPLSYTVAPGDTAWAVTARLGITPTQLGWLNPDRTASKLILADVTLNLSRENRGLRIENTKQ